MDLNTLKTWLELLSSALLLLAGVVAGLWAYSKYILERGLLPPVQFDLDCISAGLQDGKQVLEVLLHLKNLGTATLIATNIRVDVLYLNANDPLDLFDDPTGSLFGRLKFPRSIRKDPHPDKGGPSRTTSESVVKNLRTADPQKQAVADPRGIAVAPHDTFVRPGVDQIYTFVTAIPESASYVLLWSSFEYAQHPVRLGRLVLFVSRHLGLIQYTLEHVTKPHTVERVFRLSEKPATEKGN